MTPGVLSTRVLRIAAKRLLCRKLVSTLFCAIFSAILCPSSHPQEFGPDYAPTDKRLEGTVSVRDLSIPHRAFEDFQRGLQQLQKQDPARSVPYFSRAIRKFPGYYEAVYHLGVAQQRLGQDDRALDSFQSAVNLSAGKYALAEYAYALLLCRRGRPAEAELTVRYALRLNQNPALGQTTLGVVLLYQHRSDEAEKSAREALSLDAGNANAYLVLAGVHEENHDYQAKVQDLDAFLKIESQGPRARTVREIREVSERFIVQTAANQ